MRLRDQSSACAPKGPREEPPHALEEPSHALEEAPQEHDQITTAHENGLQRSHRTVESGHFDTP